MLKALVLDTIIWALGGPKKAEAPDFHALETKVVEAYELAENQMLQYNTSAEVKKEIFDLLPDDDAEPREWSEALQHIQNKYVLEVFYIPFERTLYSLRYEIATLSFDEHQKFVNGVNILRTALLGLSLKFTRGLLKQAQSLLPQEPAPAPAPPEPVEDLEDKLHHLETIPETAIQLWMWTNKIGEA